MFKVLFAPFEGQVKEEAERCGVSPHSVLVWVTDKRAKLLSGNISKSPEGRERITQRFEVACEFLNSRPSLEMVKEMVRSVYYTNAMGAEIRAEEERQNSRPKPFYPSFSGHGGTGVDGIW